MSVRLTDTISHLFIVPVNVCTTHRYNLTPIYCFSQCLYDSQIQPHTYLLFQSMSVRLTDTISHLFIVPVNVCTTHRYNLTPIYCSNQCLYDSQIQSHTYLFFQSMSVRLTDTISHLCIVSVNVCRTHRYNLTPIYCFSQCLYDSQIQPHTYLLFQSMSVRLTDTTPHLFIVSVNVCTTHRYNPTPIYCFSQCLYDSQIQPHTYLLFQSMSVRLTDTTPHLFIVSVNVCTTHRYNPTPIYCFSQCLYDSQIQPHTYLLFQSMSVRLTDTTPHLFIVSVNVCMTCVSRQKTIHRYNVTSVFWSPD